MRPNIPELTVCLIDCTPKWHLSVNALFNTLQEINPTVFKYFTSNKIGTWPVNESVQLVNIPHIDSLESYSKFMIRDLHKYVNTSHALVIQSDGYVLNGAAWNKEWLKYDYAGAPFNPSGLVGNGGFSLRSKRLLEWCSRLPQGEDHPEDAAICIRFRKMLEDMGGAKFMPEAEARKFAFEGRSWNSKEWQGVANKWENQFGFHSLLSVLPPDKKPCKIFCHSGDAGDVIYSLATMRALGGGALFLTPDCKFPYPLPPRWSRMGGDPSFVDNLRPLLEAQPYVDRCSYTHGTPFSTDHDLNSFRKFWKQRSALDTESIYQLHARAFDLKLSEDQPWLIVTNPITVPGRDIVVNLTERYRNHSFPWHELVQKYSERMLFVGTEEEAELFQGFTPPKPRIPWHKTKDMLELARVVAGSKVFLGNQSSALAIAHGLCKPVIVDEWPGNPNCRLKREGAIYGNVTEIPQSWL